MIRLLGAALAVLLAAQPALAAGGRAKPRIDAFELAVVGDRVDVSYRVFGALTDELMERIDSGIPVEFRHEIELVGRRPFLLRPRRVFARFVIQSRVAYDSLNGRYDLTRTTLEKIRGSTPEAPVVARHQTEDAAAIADWMVEVGPVELLLPQRAEDRRGLTVRVRSELGRRYVMLVFPSSVAATAERDVDR